MAQTARHKRWQRGNISQRGDTFSVRVYAGKDPLTGRDRYLTGTRSTYADAEKLRTQLLSQVDERRQPRSKVTVSQVIEQWLEVAQLEDSTRDDYDDLIRLYIEPIFGSMAAAKLDAEVLERFYARLQRCSKLCGDKKPQGHECTPLSASRVRKLHFVFRAALDKAVRWRYLSTNEAAIAEPPAFVRSEPDPPSAAEAARLLNEAATDPQWCLLLWLTMVTGCRRGEACALRWTDIDLDARMVSIERSYSKTRSGAGEKSTKTRQKRRIAVDEYTVALLRSHLETRRDACAALKIKLRDDAYVFSAAPDGSTPLLPRSVTQRYRRLAQRLGLRSTRLHALRHYSATELLSCGVDLRTVAGRLGHVDGGVTTLNTYAAWVNEADRRAADAMGTRMPRPDPSQRVPRSPYEKIAAEHRDAIANGELRPGDELPTVAELAVTYDVSNATAQRALALVRTEGLIEVTKGRRTALSRQLRQLR